jgi:hypothetical protein
MDSTITAGGVEYNTNPTMNANVGDHYNYVNNEYPSTSKLNSRSAIDSYLRNDEVNMSYTETAATNVSDTKAHEIGEKTNMQKKKKHTGSSDHTKYRNHSSAKHQMREMRHEQRERERVAIANGTAGTSSSRLQTTQALFQSIYTNTNLVAPPNAGPNWAKHRESRLAKYAKATKRRHKRHEKRMRESEATRKERAETEPAISIGEPGTGLPGKSET